MAGINFLLFCEGGDSDVLQFDNFTGKWLDFATMKQKEDCKIEISTVHCSLVESYIHSNTSGGYIYTVII